MKNFTLLALAMMTMGTAAQAQVKQSTFRNPIHHVSPLDKLKAQLGIPVKSQSQSSVLRAPSLSKADKAKMAIKLYEAASASDGGKYVAKHREEYFPMESGDEPGDESGDESENEPVAEVEWELGSTYELTYDENGNILQELLDDGETLLRTTNTWNANGKLTEEIQAVSEDGGETFTNSSRRVQTYDSYFPELTLTKYKYNWDTNLKRWLETGDSFRRKVTRDADNNVTGLTLAVPYNGAYDIITRITNTFDPDTKQAATHKTEGLTSDGEDGFVFETDFYLKDMKWLKTNGQLVSAPDEWMSYGNKLSSATIYNDDETVDGTLNYTYNADDEGYLEVAQSTDGTVFERTELKFTDNNGSYEFVSETYKAAEAGAEPTLSEGTKEVSKFDDKGNLILSEGFEWNPETQAYDQTEGTRYEITYDEEIPTAEKEVISYMYDFDAQDYVMPDMKLTFSDYVKVSTGINSVVKNADAANAPAVYYDLQGIRTLNPTHGVYLMKQGGVVRKVIK